MGDDDKGWRMVLAGGAVVEGDAVRAYLRAEGHALRELLAPGQPTRAELLAALRDVAAVAEDHLADVLDRPPWSDVADLLRREDAAAKGGGA